MTSRGMQGNAGDLTFHVGTVPDWFRHDLYRATGRADASHTGRPQAGNVERDLDDELGAQPAADLVGQRQDASHARGPTGDPSNSTSTCVQV